MNAISRVKLWEAINKYVEICGGHVDPEHISINRKRQIAMIVEICSNIERQATSIKIDQMQERCNRLEEALSPFAKYAEKLPPIVEGVRRMIDDCILSVIGYTDEEAVIRATDFRKALAILKENVSKSGMCDQVISWTCNENGDPTDEIECGKPARWRWKHCSSVNICDSCAQDYENNEPDLFSELVFVGENK